jgi:hypothetical protein
MQKAFITLAGNGIFCVGKIEYDGAVFHHDRPATGGEEIFERFGQSLWSHPASFPETPAAVCDE